MKKWMKPIFATNNPRLPSLADRFHTLFASFTSTPLQVIAQLMRTIQSEIKEFRRKWFWFLPLKNGWFWADFDFLKTPRHGIFVSKRPSFSHIFRNFEVPFCSNEVHPFQVSLSLCHCWCPGRSTSLPWNSAGGFSASSRPKCVGNPCYNSKLK